jgi:ankyrin repeat protein
MVIFLIEKGAKLNVKEGTNGWTPLHLACMGGHVDIVKRLTKAGASTSKKDFHGATPQDCAGMFSETSIGRRIDKLLG